MIPFGAWRPDVAQFESQYSSEALNVIPSDRGFRPLPRLISVSSGTPGSVPQGAVSVRDLSGVIYNFCGDATKLYKLNSATLAWDDVSRTVGGPYSTSPTGIWSFSQYGNTLMADNGVDAAQVFTIGTSSNFSALGGSAPIARYGAIVQEFAVKANVASANSTVQWSAIGNPLSWATSATTLADSQILPDAGQIMGIAGGQVGVVFQERAIVRMSYEGPPTIFRFDKVSNTIGCRVPGSIAAWDDTVFVLTQEGFYQIAGGQQLTAIGYGKVDRYIEANLSGSFIHRCSAAIDPINKLYIFSYASVNSSGAADALLIYHWPTGEWSRSDQAVAYLYSGYNQTGYTLDTLDTLSASIDDLALSLDSPTLASANRLNLIGLISPGSFNGIMAFFSGENTSPIVETGEFQLVDGRRALLRQSRPMIDAPQGLSSGTIYVQPYTRNSLHEARSAGAKTAVNTHGIAPHRSNARYHKLRLSIEISGRGTMKWDHLLGFDDIKVSNMGKR